MTEQERPKPSELPPHVLADINAALEMGIRDTEAIKELVQSATHEELRAKANQMASEVTAQFEKLQRTTQTFADLVQEYLTAPTKLAGFHMDAQEAILKRVKALASEATAEELTNLVAAYIYMPQPYSQNFDPNAPTFAGTEDEGEEQSD